MSGSTFCWSTKQTCIKIHMCSYWVVHLLLYIHIYKITKIVHALWLAERRVCMRVKHGCDVKVFCFSLANHASTNLNTFLSWKLDKFSLFTHSPSSIETWKILTYLLCQFFFFRLSWYFKREKSIFWKAFFCTTRTDPENLNKWRQISKKKD